MKLFLLCLATLPLFAAPNFEAAYESQKKELRHTDVCHPQLLIAFSGTPGMGKTHLAKQLEQRLQAIRISSDESRIILRKLRINPEAEEDGERNIVAYGEYLLGKLHADSCNQLIILDSSIDRTYKELLEYAAEHGLHLFVIRMDIPYFVAKERLSERPEAATRFLPHFKKWRADYEAFPPSLVDYTYSGDEDLNSLVQKIQRLLAEEKKQAA